VVSIASPGAWRREWKTNIGKANFITPATLATDIRPRRSVISCTSSRCAATISSTPRCMAPTIGSVACTGHGWCNDMARFEVDDCDIVSLTTAVDDGRRAAVRHSQRQHRWVLPLVQCADPAVASRRRKTPAAKSILVRVQRSQLWTTVFEKQRPLGRIPCQPSRGREGLYVAEYSGEMASFEGNRS
jgi:hypothetical protein